MKKLLVSLLGGTLLATYSMAADVKIGFVTTLTTPAAVIGKDMENAVNLAMAHLGGKAGSHIWKWSLATMDLHPTPVNK